MADIPQENIQSEDDYTQEEIAYLMDYLLPIHSDYRVYVDTEFNLNWEMIAKNFNEHFNSGRKVDALRKEVRSVKQQRESASTGVWSPRCIPRNIMKNVKQECAVQFASTEEPSMNELTEKMKRQILQMDMLKIEYQIKVKAMEVEALQNDILKIEHEKKMKTMEVEMLKTQLEIKRKEFIQQITGNCSQ